MKRIFLSAIGLLSLLQSFGQSTNSDSSYKKRKLQMEEINVLSSYYHQNGNNAVVTGGIGSEKLTDISNVIDLTYIGYGKKYKHVLDVELGIDYYTSASSDMIDLKANSSASHADVRIYPSVTYGLENVSKGLTYTGGVTYSKEFDYQSIGLNAGFSKKTKNKNGEFSASFQALFDQVSLILPIELRTNGNSMVRNYPTTARNTFVGSLSYEQIVNDKFKVLFLADIIQQNGYLSLPFHRVYFNDNTVHLENLPGSRTKLPVAVRASYFATDNIIVKAYYRYYSDNWGLKAHTIELETPIKINAFFSVSPFYRYYTQAGMKYFAPYKVHTAADTYYVSNYDLSNFQSSFYGTGIKYTPLRGVLGLKEINTVEIRYGHYTRNTNFNSDIISVAIKFK